MNNPVFGKTMENVRKDRDIKLVTTDRRSKCVSEPNYHTTKWFSSDLIAIEMRKTKIKMDKSIYLGMSMLGITKTVMYKYYYDYIKPNYQNRADLCYMDTDILKFHIKTEDVHKDIADDVKDRSDTSN